MLLVTGPITPYTIKVKVNIMPAAARIKPARNAQLCFLCWAARLSIFKTLSSEWVTQYGMPLQCHHACMQGRRGEGGRGGGCFGVS